MACWMCKLPSPVFYESSWATITKYWTVAQRFKQHMFIFLQSRSLEVQVQGACSVGFSWSFSLVWRITVMLVLPHLVGPMSTYTPISSWRMLARLTLSYLLKMLCLNTATLWSAGDELHDFGGTGSPYQFSYFLPSLQQPSVIPNIS